MIYNFPKDKMKKNLSTEILDKVILGGKFIYPSLQECKVNEKALKSYRKMIMVLTKLQREGKCNIQYDDPDILYSDHEVNIEWISDDPLEVEAKDIIDIVTPLIKAKENEPVNIEPSGNWVFFIDIYTDLEE